ncbi:UPF0729 protein GD16342 [Anastrepha obliqua]|uniref:UPF0729 protein GD16342 n=1 Tax=Anastrepha obliqua TaxID=95512 RepID=UPI002409FC38|nr:UPF0729 protein GD16342 [Anastrepha obliqua]
MVCVPCFIIPVLLYIWHKFFQPIVLPIIQRYWNPWEKKDAQGNVIKNVPEFPFECKGGSCPYTGSKNKTLADGGNEKSAVANGASDGAETATIAEAKKDN